MSPVPETTRSTAAVLLAAGKGTRMQSDLPKVMHEVADRPMLHWVVDAVRSDELASAHSYLEGEYLIPGYIFRERRFSPVICLRAFLYNLVDA